MKRSPRGPLLMLGLMVGVVSARPAAAQTATGNANVHLGVPPATTLETTSIQIDNPSIGYSGLVEFGGGSGPFMVTHLPAATGYVATVASTTLSGGTCTGATGFPIFTDGTTIVFVNLACQQPLPAAVPALGRRAPWLVLSLALLGAIIIRRRRPAIR